MDLYKRGPPTLLLCHLMATVAILSGRLRENTASTHLIIATRTIGIRSSPEKREPATTDDITQPHRHRTKIRQTKDDGELIARAIMVTTKARALKLTIDPTPCMAASTRPSIAKDLFFNTETPRSESGILVIEQRRDA